MQAARKAFDKTRKPLEEVVRLQREELARRKVGQGRSQRQPQRQRARARAPMFSVLLGCCLCEICLVTMVEEQPPRWLYQYQDRRCILVVARSHSQHQDNH